jgi:hypothetical protein
MVAAGEGRGQQSAIVKAEGFVSEYREASPLVWRGRLILMTCVRPVSGSGDRYIRFEETEGDEPGREISRLGEGYGLACALTHFGRTYVFASHYEDLGWHDVTMFVSQDLKSWRQQRVILELPEEDIFNTSVCADGRGYVMAYESSDRAHQSYTIRFARSSDDLEHWRQVDGAGFPAKSFSSGPTIRFVGGRYYLLHSARRGDQFVVEATRSADLKIWEPSPLNPVLSPGAGEDISTSDIDLAEHNGKVHLFYCVGNQQTHHRLKRARYDGSLESFFAGFYPEAKP